MKIRRGGPSDDHTVASMFREMWIDNDVAADGLVDDWQARICSFIAQHREASALQSFIATDDERAIACALCQIFGGLYPDILKPKTRRYGYLWGVYTIPEYRRRGVGRALTERCVTHLRELGCSHAVLHAAPMGVNVYADLGFVPNNEMRLTL